MNSIIGFSELALDDKLPSKTQNYLGKILENAEGLLQIINDILDISKIESGKMELEFIPFDLHDIFSRCQTVIMPKAMEQGVTMHFYAEPAINKIIIGDPMRLRQVLINFLSNAVKFTNFGTVKLSATVVSSPVSKNNNSIEICFEVKDNGIGMTPDQVARINEPFTQADSSTTRKYGGTGLGLPISKNIIELMGSKLVIESTPGVGSKFSFNVVFEIADASITAPAGSMPINELEKPIFEGEILLCEDNYMNQHVVSDHLSRVGLKTTIAGNGKEGVEMVMNRINNREKPFDLIFMDIHMPVMDGLEAASRINALGTGTPIVAMTANVMTSETEKYKENGMPDCVGKPFTSQELWNCLLKYLPLVDRETVNKITQKEADTEMLKMLQVNFVKYNKNKYDEFTEALKMDDIKLAHRIVHTLKSNAGQLGRESLQKIAAELENLLKDGKNLVTDNHLEILNNELTIVLNDYKPLIEKSGAGSEIDTAIIPENYREKALELAAELQPLLKSGSPKSLKFIDELQVISGSNELIQQLINQIDNFEFELAISTLAKLQEEWIKEKDTK
jgi:CheY-like chemotaxis protein